MKLENKNSKKENIENINKLPLFSYLPEFDDQNDQNSDKFRASHLLNHSANISKYYITNFSLFIGVLCGIFFMFYVQFKTDDLQNNIVAIDKKITAYENEIRVLKVEWVYLTRPARLRILAKRYLKGNNNIDSNQVKDIATLKGYYLANLKKRQSKDLAMKIKH